MFICFRLSLKFIIILQCVASNPKIFLTPFMLSALLTLCNASRYLESVRLSSSSTLPFIRSVIQKNEKEVELSNNSAWFRDALEYSTVNVQKVYSILVQQRYCLLILIVSLVQYSQFLIDSQQRRYFHTRFGGNGICFTENSQLFADQCYGNSFSRGNDKSATSAWFWNCAKS